MAWTYSQDPTSSKKDEVRFLIGDTDSRDPLLQDEEILYLLTMGGVFMAAILASESISAKFSRLADVKVGELAKQASQMAIAYRRLATDLRHRYLLFAGVTASFGGISRAKEQEYDQDPDNIPSPFRNEQFDHPGTPDFQSGRNLTRLNGGDP